MIRFLQTPGPVKKYVLGGILIVISISMVWYLVPSSGNSGYSFGATKGVIAQVDGHGLAESVHDVAEVLAIGPHLSLVHGVNAFGENFEGFIAKDDAMGAAAERVDHKLALARFEQDDGARLRLQGTQLAQQAVAFERALLQVRADHGDIRLVLLEQSQSVVGIHGAADDGDAIALGPESASDQLAIHVIRFRDHDIDDRTPDLPRVVHGNPLQPRSLEI